MTRTRTAVTLMVLVVVLVVMLGYGWRAASKPFPPLGAKANTCQTVKVKNRIFRAEITVSVYNATGRKGLADRTMADLEKRGFHPGEVGNAAAKDKVGYVQVRSTTQDDPAARLVAAQFKPPAMVVLADDELGPGIDVILGRRFTKLHVPSPKSQKLAEPVRTCLDKVTADPNAGLGGA